MVEASTRPAPRLMDTFRDWWSRHPYWMLALLTIFALIPFLTKPFNLDDPLYVWAAQQIQLHPGNPYGFDVNWFGVSQPIWAATLNPPLMSYYLAVAAGIFGGSETGLHFACLLPAVAVVLGTYRLAGNLCRRPMFAALATLFAPGFLVSSTTVMADVPMLAFWVWTIVFWTEGLRQNQLGKLMVAGILLALAILTKYNGICLLPLLIAYGWMEKRTWGCWPFFLLIPVVALCAHEWLTFQLYGHPHFLFSNQFARTHQKFHGLGKLLEVFNAVTFTGGCFAIAVFCMPWLWDRRGLLLITGGGGLFVALAVAGGVIVKNYSWVAGRQVFPVEMQLWLWTVSGACILALSLAEISQKRDAGSWLLALWVWGIFLFAAFVYWMVNVRVILPMIPALGILLTRRLEQNSPTLPGGVKFSLAISAGLSLLSAQADFQMADTARKLAGQVSASHAGKPGQVWFDGHWGFQYYLQLKGGRPLDAAQGGLAPGDLLFVQVQNANFFSINTANARPVEAFVMPDLPWFATFNYDVGAGFYSQVFGPLPFAFGHVPPETVVGYALKNPSQNPP